MMNVGNLVDALSGENGNLKRFRKERGCTQKQIADYLEMTTQGYSKIERGENNLRPKHFIRLCALYEKTNLNDWVSCEKSWVKGRKTLILVDSKFADINIKMLASTLKVLRAEKCHGETKSDEIDKILVEALGFRLGDSDYTKSLENRYRKYEKEDEGNGMCLEDFLKLMNYFGYDDVAEFLRVGNDSTPKAA